METSSLRRNRPHLESALGPLSPEDDSRLRAMFDEVDSVLLETARHFKRDRAGWQGTGLELTWKQSGQVSISSHVSAQTDRREGVDFCIELRPSWYFGERSSTMNWEVVTEIHADRPNVIGPSVMDTVYETSARATTAMEAAAAMLRAVHELRGLAISSPVKRWLDEKNRPKNR